MNYPNPLIPGFNPDPSCVLVDGTYYLITSSFEYLPGLPLYRSTDFRSWEHIGNVAEREEQVGLAHVPSGMGVWAPTIRYRDGVYHVIVTIAESPRGTVVYTATDPAGPWSDGVALDGIEGIDPDLAWDDDGGAYVTYSGLTLSGPRAGTHLGILQARVDLDTGTVLEEPRSLWSGTGLQFPEAPHVVRRGKYWYLIIAEGGTERGHAVSVARSRSIAGPYEGAAHNPILSAAGRDLPVQNTGHADLVTGPDGRDRLVLLGMRPLGAAMGFSPLGRETFTTGIEWNDGWPHAQSVQAAPDAGDLAEVFRFADPLDLEDPGWVAVGRHPRDLAFLDDGLRLPGVAGGLGAFRPAFIGRRQRHLTSTVATILDTTTGTGGLALRYDEHFHLTLAARTTAHGTTVTATAAMPTIHRQWTAEVPGPTVRLRIETRAVARGPAAGAGAGERIRLLAAGRDGTGEVLLAEVDGRFWSAETAASFTGRIIGMYAETGIARFEEFRYHGEGGSRAM